MEGSQAQAGDGVTFFLFRFLNRFYGRKVHLRSCGYIWVYWVYNVLEFYSYNFILGEQCIVQLEDSTLNNTTINNSTFNSTVDSVKHNKQ